ncbi:MAG TPA: RNA chaperone Hfq [Candidatus Acidoferrales bacterium]|nr:RNA chaperone Hfq [Candidatus Acidoferrales bacterium]
MIRPPLGNVKESYNPPAPTTQPQQHQPQPRKKPAPPEQTHAENFYFVKQMQARTPMTVVMTDGEVLNGTVEWYDRDCIKLTRYGSPNLMVYKHSIKYMFKSSEEASGGGSNSPATNGEARGNGGTGGTNGG